LGSFGQVVSQGKTILDIDQSVVDMFAIGSGRNEKSL
jgi:hypothetical protein